MSDEQLERLLTRLEDERAAADRAYSEALRHVDQMFSPTAGIAVRPGTPGSGGLKGAIGRLIYKLFAPFRQFTAAQAQFDTALIQYFQTLTPYIETKDHASPSQRELRALAGALGAMSDDWMKRWASLAAREARYEARNAALTAAYDALRETVALAQQSTLSLKRDVARLLEAGVAVVPAGAPGARTASAAETEAHLDSYVYVGFEDRFRGSTEEIRARLLDYLPLFDGATDVLDVGCGRGELLDLFRQRGVGARGIDVNAEMVEVCRSRGLVADLGDAVTHLTALRDASLGGLIAIQVVEHLEPGYLMKFIETAGHKLRPGAVMVLETINPGCWTAFFDSYIRDLTHVRPLHPDTLRYLVQAGGFTSADIQYRSPVLETDRLRRVQLPHTVAADTDATLIDLVDALNANADTLNARMFTYRDYAIVARR